MRDIALIRAPDPVIASYARNNELCLVTGDFGFADVRNYPPQQYKGLVVLQLPNNATATVILDLIEALLKQPQLLELVPGQLAIVEPERVRFRSG